MAKTCILGNNCPNKVARRNLLFRLSSDADESTDVLSESCVFCGTCPMPKKRKTNVSQPWTSKNWDGESNLLSELKPCREQNIEDKIKYFKSQLPIYKKEPDTSNSQDFPLVKTEASKKQKTNLPLEIIDVSSSSQDEQIIAEVFSEEKVTTESEVEECNKIPSTSRNSSLKSRYMDMSLLSKHKVERLLYKSFKLQHLDIYSSSSEDSCTENIDAKKTENGKKKKKKRRPKKYNCSEHIGSGFYKWKRGHSSKWQDPSTSMNSFGPNFEHDYSCSEFNKIVESNVDRLALETENFWDEEIILDNDESTVEEVDSYTSNRDSQARRSSPEDLNRSDHMYCVQPQNKEVIDLNSPESDKTDKYDVEAEMLETLNSKLSTPGKRIWECPICLEQANGQEIATTLCGHIFCKDCIESYLVTNASCPSCRTNIQEKPLITLFNFA